MSISYRGGFKFEPENDVSLEVFNKKDGRAKGNKHCTQSLTRMHNLQWCNCTICCIMMFSDVENLCCSEVIAVKQKLLSHRCITSSSSFVKVCLDVEVLQVFITAMNDFIGETINTELHYRFTKLLFFYTSVMLMLAIGL